MKFVWSGVIASSLAAPMACFAVGLGPIQVKSGLNQPFNAQIELLSLRNVPLTGIKVKMAGDNEFKQAGLIRPHYLEAIKFSVEKSKEGKPIIHLMTQDRMNEPYLKFLLDVAWSEGQFYREYTVLLDPPSYTINNEMKPKKPAIKPVQSAETPKAAESVKPAEVSKVVESVKPAEVSTVTPSESVKVIESFKAKEDDAPNVIERSQITAIPKEKSDIKPLDPSHLSEIRGMGSNVMMAPKPLEMPTRLVTPKSPRIPEVPQPGQTIDPPVTVINTPDDAKPAMFGPTSKNDDLFQIAVRFRPSEKISLNQAMLAIKKLNPQAFNLDNVNSLKTGMTLKIPTASMMAAIPADIAKAEVQRENQEWLKPTTVITKPVVASVAPEPHISHKDMIAHLLITQNDVDMGSNIETSAILNPPDQETSHQANTMEKTLRTELAMTAEAVNAMKQANMDLQQQLVQLQEKNSELTHTLQAREQELKELRRTLALNTAQVNVTTVPGIASQVTSDDVHVQKSYPRNKLWVAALLLMSAGSAGFYAWFRRRSREPLWLKPEEESPVQNAEVADLEELSGEDVLSSKLDLATAYIDMEDHAAARELLEEVMAQGSPEQRHEAKKLLKKMA